MCTCLCEHIHGACTIFDVFCKITGHTLVTGVCKGGVSRGRSAEISKALWEQSRTRPGGTADRWEEGNGSGPLGQPQESSPGPESIPTRRWGVRMDAVKMELLPCEGSRHCVRAGSRLWLQGFNWKVCKEFEGAAKQSDADSRADGERAQQASVKKLCCL